MMLFAALHESAAGPNAKSGGALKFSAYRGRPDVTGGLSIRRHSGLVPADRDER
jgi:hypothetical protein